MARKTHAKTFVVLMQNGQRLYKVEYSVDAMFAMADEFCLDTNKLLRDIEQSVAYTLDANPGDCEIIVEHRNYIKVPTPRGLRTTSVWLDEAMAEHYYESYHMRGGTCACGSYVSFDNLGSSHRLLAMSRHIQAVRPPYADGVPGPRTMAYLSRRDYSAFRLPQRVLSMEPLRLLIEALVLARSLRQSPERDQLIDYYLNEIDLYMKG